MVVRLVTPNLRGCDVVDANRRLMDEKRKFHI
jgi:hypothetical protein